MITIVYSGNLGRGHELDTLVLAVKQLDAADEVEVQFYGSGKARQGLEDLAAEKSLSNIEFNNAVPLRQLPDVLKRADVHYVSQKSDTEGVIVPSKIYGVLAAGRPTLFVGPEHCEVAAILRESGAGIVVNSSDVSGLAKAIGELASDQRLRLAMGQKARKYYETHLGRERSVGTIIGAIEAVVGRKGL